MNEWFEAEQHAERAHRFYEAGQWSKALDELNRALAVNPDQAEWRLGLGLTLDALERYDEAIAAYERSLELAGDNFETLLHLGIDLIRVGKPQKALAVLERSSTLEPDDPEPYVHRITAFTQVGDHESAELNFYLAQQGLNPDEEPELAAISFDHIAHSLTIRGELDRAIWCWRRCLELDPDAPQVNANLARASWRAGRLDEAREHYLGQLRGEPGDIPALLELGSLLIEQDRYAEAGEKFRRVLEMDPSVAEAQLRLGELALRVGHHDAAASRLERSRRLRPKQPGLNLALARLAKQRGDLEAARHHALAELKQQTQSPSQIIDLARLLIDLGRPAESETLLTPLLAPPHGGDPASDNPDQLSRPALPSDNATQAAALLCRGVARFKLGNQVGGAADCRGVLRLDPGNTLAMQNLVLAHLGANRFGRAAVWLRKALRRSPNHPELLKLRRMLQRRRLLALLPWR